MPQLLAIMSHLIYLANVKPASMATENVYQRRVNIAKCAVVATFLAKNRASLARWSSDLVKTAEPYVVENIG